MKNNKEKERGMMDKRFELTPEEIWAEHRNWITSNAGIGFYKALSRAQVAKVLSLLEPVELEALGDDVIKAKIAESYPCFDKEEEDALIELENAISQATIAANQAKGQLYRVKGG